MGHGVRVSAAGVGAGVPVARGQVAWGQVPKGVLAEEPQAEAEVVGPGVVEDEEWMK